MGCPNESDLTKSIGRRAAAAVVDTRDHKSLHFTFAFNTPRQPLHCKYRLRHAIVPILIEHFTAAADRVTFLPLSRLIAIIGGGGERGRVVSRKKRWPPLKWKYKKEEKQNTGNESSSSSEKKLSQGGGGGRRSRKPINHKSRKEKGSRGTPTSLSLSSSDVPATFSQIPKKRSSSFFRKKGQKRRRPR